MTEITNVPLKPLLTTLDVTLEELRSGSRKPRISDARAMLATLLNQKYHLSQAVIGTLFNTRQANVSHMISRHRNLLLCDKYYRQKWQEIESLIL